MRALAPLLSAAAFGLLLSSCCCPCEDGCGCDPSACEGIDIDPTPSGPLVDLGIHSYPSAHSTGNPTMHSWTARRIHPSGYQIGYRLSPDEAARIRQALQNYGPLGGLPCGG